MPMMRNETDVPATLLTPHPSNPRRGDVAVIEQSMRTNGWFGTLVVQTSTGHILAGNHRFKVWTETLGHTTIPAVQYLDCDDDTALRILAADNRSSDLGNYDEDVLRDLLQTLGGETLDGLIGTGYTDEDLNALLAWDTPITPNPTSPPTTTGTTKPETKPGAATTQAMTFDFEPATFTTVTTRFTALRTEHNLPTNTAVLLRLLGLDQP